MALIVTDSPSCSCGMLRRHTAKVPHESLRVTMGVILSNDVGDVLLQLRDDRADIMFPRHWVSPGDVETGESFEEAARREFSEETGTGPELLSNWASIR